MQVRSRWLPLFAALPIILTTWHAPASPRVCLSHSEALIQALDADRDLSRQGVQALRARGPEGLNEVLALREEIRERYAREHIPINPLPHQVRLREQLWQLESIIDQVGGQLHCGVSRLYWYTDIAEAQEAARTLGKPILSLRLLGELTESCSCANSRFFRTALYSNEEISATMREHFVLHWETVRPVPVITIDFGDGHVLQRTLTGNSAHYLLDADGRPLDVLPGMYGPAAFLNWLSSSRALSSQWHALTQPEAETSDQAREEFLARYHQEQADRTHREIQGDLASIQEAESTGLPSPSASEAPNAQTEETEETEGDDLPLGVESGGGFSTDLDLPFPKRTIEFRIQDAINPLSVDAYLADLSPEMLAYLEPATWIQIAALHTEFSQLDESSIELMRQENPTALAAGGPHGPILRDRSLDRMIQRFEQSIALDTVRNEYVLHLRIHQWFAEQTAGQDRHVLNERVYAELFFAPLADPWLGLIPPDAYAALPQNGLIASSPPPLAEAMVLEVQYETMVIMHAQGLVTDEELEEALATYAAQIEEVRSELAARLLRLQ